MPYDVLIVHEPGRDLAVTPFETTPEEIGQLIGPASERVSRYLAERGAPPAGPAVAYYERGPEGLIVAVGYSVPRPIPVEGDVIMLHLPDADVVTTTHTGSFEDLAKAYEALRHGAAEQGRAVEEAGGMWEEFWSDTGNPNEHSRIEVFWPLAPA